MCMKLPPGGPRRSEMVPVVFLYDPCPDPEKCLALCSLPHPTSNGAYRVLPNGAHAAQPRCTLVRHPLSPLTSPHTAPAPCVRLVSPGGLQCLLLSAPFVVAVVTYAYGTTQVVTWLFKTNSGSKRANQESS